jgi:hypothetical protein
MKAYIATTGVIFVLITAVHLLRACYETHLATDPGYLLLTLLTAGLSVWAGRLLLRPTNNRG